MPEPQLQAILSSLQRELRRSLGDQLDSVILFGSRALQLADRDITAFRILSQEPDAHLSIVCFHAQQAVEKSLKAVLFSRRIEFRHIHDLTELTQLLRQHGIKTPVTDDLLGR